MPKTENTTKISCSINLQQAQNSKDYEYLPETSETIIYISMVHLMLRRLGQSRTFKTASEPVETIF